jgi:hypothetical protein
MRVKEKVVENMKVMEMRGTKVIKEVRRMRENAVLMTVLTISLVFALMPVAVPAVGADDVACDWTGTWDTCWGKMELVQTGNDVTGTASLTLPKRTNLNRSYKQDKGDKILGRVFDNALRGVWLRYPNDPPENAGNIVFIISEDCSSFDGKWQYGLREYGEEKWDSSSSNWDGNWTGSRVGPSKQASKQSVCASAKPRIAGASEFTTTEFTIGGTEPQEVRITQPAENFGIVNVYGGKYGGRVYQRIKGESWGSLTLEPGTYRLSCGGGGVSGLMSATVCIEYPGVEETPTGPDEEFPEVEHPPEKPEVLSGKESKPSLPLGPIEKIVVRSAEEEDSIELDHLIMVIGEKKCFWAWGEDVNGNKKDVTVEEWEVDDKDRGSIDRSSGEFKAGPKEGEVKIKATGKNQEGNDITGAFYITVSAEPAITFVGRLEFFDENGIRIKHVSLAGVTVMAQVLTQKSAVASLGEIAGIAKSTHTGEFKFVLPAKFKDVDLWNFEALVQGIPAPRGYEWISFGADLDARGKPGKTSHIDPIECCLMEIEMWIKGTITHHVSQWNPRGGWPERYKRRLLFRCGQAVKGEVYAHCAIQTSKTQGCNCAQLAIHKEGYMG